MTLYEASYQALLRIPAPNVNDVITANASACAALGGTIKPLNISTTTCEACSVLFTNVAAPPLKKSAAAPSVASDGSGSSSSTAIIVGVIVGVVVLVASALFFRRRLRKAAKGQKDDATNGSTQQSTISSTQLQSKDDKETSADEIDVRCLRPVRLELGDLHVLSTKPRASGGNGEVWLGQFGRDRVAIKRLTNKSPAHVHKFVEEIHLMSRYLM
ncbi:hypothetical protein ACHHYP_20485 [Achlya hypogyna]|uniref:Protein kinase domain-containing protein n=1 Tax=Achlya hypogyna TaxID=1202772 RepID=A0A1V9YL48_ACHHY|nr:hypothetical protein ACHHYP_20485 [Achlya hypogyna]